MKHRFDPANIGESLIGARGLPYPGMFFLKRGSSANPDEFELQVSAPEMQEFTKKGSRLYAQDALGCWFFMPVYIKVDDVEIEIPQARINITGKKTIIETALVGRKGTVKELICTDDYNVSIELYIQSGNGTYPEEQIEQIQQLWKADKAVELQCALTDLLFDKGDKIVLKSISYPSTIGAEDFQVVSIEAVTDAPFELVMD